MQKKSNYSISKDNCQLHLLYFPVETCFGHKRLTFFKDAIFFRYCLKSPGWSLRIFINCMSPLGNNCHSNSHLNMSTFLHKATTNVISWWFVQVTIVVFLILMMYICLWRPWDRLGFRATSNLNCKCTDLRSCRIHTL